MGVLRMLACQLGGGFLRFARVRPLKEMRNTILDYEYDTTYSSRQ